MLQLTTITNFNKENFEDISFYSVLATFLGLVTPAIGGGNNVLVQHDNMNTVCMKLIGTLSLQKKAGTLLKH